MDPIQIKNMDANIFSFKKIIIKRLQHLQVPVIVYLNSYVWSQYTKLCKIQPINPDQHIMSMRFTQFNHGSTLECNQTHDPRYVCVCVYGYGWLK